MKTSIINSDSDEVSLSIEEADIGILYVVQHELLKNTEINFAGVIVKHPLTGECWMRVNSNTTPLDDIKAATDSAIATTRQFKDLLTSKIKVVE